MPRFSANLGFLFPDLPFLERFDAAARAGFTAVEYAAPYEYPAAELRSRLNDARHERVVRLRIVGGRRQRNDRRNGEQRIRQRGQSKEESLDNPKCSKPTGRDVRTRPGHSAAHD